MNSIGRIAALVTIALASASGVAHSQSIYGPGGLFLNPTADLPTKGQLTPAFLVIPYAGSARRPAHSDFLHVGLRR